MAHFRVGVIGVGSMGRNHVRVLSMMRDVELAFVHDTDPEAARAVAAQYETRVAACTDEDLSGVDGVVLVTPTSTHLEWVRRIAGRVPNVFIEKPLASTLEESEELVELARRSGSHLQVGFIERYNPAIVSLRHVLRDGGGLPIALTFQRTNRLSSRIQDVDVVVDLMIHDIDLALYLAGPVVNVHSYGIVQDGMVVFASAILTHERGTYSHLTASRVTERRIRHITATCNNMYVDCDLLRKEIQISRQSTTQSYPSIRVASSLENVQITDQEPLLSEHIDFVSKSTGSGKSLTFDVDTPNIDTALESARIADSISRTILGV